MLVVSGALIGKVLKANHGFPLHRVYGRMSVRVFASYQNPCLSSNALMQIKATQSDICIYSFGISTQSLGFLTSDLASEMTELFHFNLERPTSNLQSSTFMILPFC